MLCDSIQPGSDAARFEVALLRARVFLRLDIPDKTIDALRSCAYTSLSPDEYVSGEMLLGAAYVRLGQLQRGRSILERVYGESRKLHDTVRAELTLNLGIANYMLGNVNDSRALLSLVGPGEDIIYARAQEYLGWVSFARGELAASESAFRAALATLGQCKNHDRFVEANVLAGLASVSPELLHTNGWADLELRIRNFDWSPSGLSRPHFWASLYASYMAELSGRSTDACDWARRAEMISDELGYVLIAQCRMAALFRSVGETHAQLEFLARAKRIYEKVSLRELAGDFAQAPLNLAEELAYAGDAQSAARVAQQYRDVIAPTLHQAPVNDRADVLLNCVDAAVLEASGERKAAIIVYEIAFATSEGIGLRHRACTIALRLAELTQDSKYRSYLQNALSMVPDYWTTRALERFDRGVLPRLSTSQSDILDLVAEGKTYKEIAALRGGSWKTARNLVHALFRKFDVRSKGELVAAAARRGLLDRSAKEIAR
jgi:DNA-binding CsgD family transcriptional regulator